MGSRELLALGIPIVNAVHNAAFILVGTCPKFHDTVTIEALAGGESPRTTGAGSGATATGRPTCLGWWAELARAPRARWGGP
ncbi:MAG: hypothetical protein ABIG98_01705 [Chloroflexota bacterium]